MAEVPEVETIVRDLRVAVVGRELQGAEILNIDAVRFPAPAQFADMVAGRRVLAAERRAKHILMPLSDELLLEVHFMLWGTLRLIEAAAPRLPETLVVWHLDGGEELRLTDKLGYARTALGWPDDLIERLNIDELGPEALDPAFDAGVLAARLAKRRGALKTVLLNQKVLAGLGNRDADESMWLAQINPLRTPASLAPGEIERLHDAICQNLEEGIALRGTQRDLFGRQGQARHRRNIFERSGQPCPRCGARIEYLRIGGRNSFFCPECQK
ncbi:MAG TPA: DNA-formamidopyrimidine glycosylase family protein [Roseiflexaceae bacterium]|nr:DNA-formamidopyrimidine glycosylase family protein [Roseiflexaceae bacterium]